jgi:hypothetical protein
VSSLRRDEPSCDATRLAERAARFSVARNKSTLGGHLDHDKNGEPGENDHRRVQEATILTVVSLKESAGRKPAFQSRPPEAYNLHVLFVDPDAAPTAVLNLASERVIEPRVLGLIVNRPTPRLRYARLPWAIASHCRQVRVVGVELKGDRLERAPLGRSEAGTVLAIVQSRP